MCTTASGAASTKAGVHRLLFGSSQPGLQLHSSGGAGGGQAHEAEGTGSPTEGGEDVDIEGKLASRAALSPSEQVRLTTKGIGVQRRTAEDSERPIIPAGSLRRPGRVIGRSGREGDVAAVGRELVHQVTGALGVEEIVIGMPHRGRLNVLANIMNKNVREIFAAFRERDEIQAALAEEGEPGALDEPAFAAELADIRRHRIARVKDELMPGLSALENGSYTMAMSAAFLLDVHAGSLLVVRGAVVMAGYWEQPDETAETLRGGWLHTGDVGSFDADGYLTLRDRSKDLIIRGGSNIYPREIEEVLLRHPAIVEVSVVGREHADLGEEPIAFVVTKPGQQVILLVNGYGGTPSLELYLMVNAARKVLGAAGVEVVPLFARLRVADLVWSKVWITLADERWVSGSKTRMVSTSSSNRSSR